MRGCTSDQSNIDDHRKNLKQPESHLKAYIQPKKRNISIHIPPRGTTRKAPRMTHGLMKNEAMTAKNTICVCTTESDDLIEEIVLREGKRPAHIILAPETQKKQVEQRSSLFIECLSGFSCFLLRPLRRCPLPLQLLEAGTRHAACARR